MNVIECIQTRRSIRTYTDEPISDETMNFLIELGTKAATASYQQPWAFVAINDKEGLARLSEAIKKDILEDYERNPQLFENFPHMDQYKSWMADENFSIFNHAAQILIIYGDTSSKFYREDCSLCAGNIMLAAHSMGIGVCWIGFAANYLNKPEFKQKYHTPEQFQLVSVLSMGYSAAQLKPPRRKDARLFYRGSVI